MKKLLLFILSLVLLTVAAKAQVVFSFQATTNNAITFNTNIVVNGTLSVNSPTNTDWVANMVATGWVGLKTNYFASNFKPVPGIVFFVASNNAIYSVSMTRTNLISAQ